MQCAIVKTNFLYILCIQKHMFVCSEHWCHLLQLFFVRQMMRKKLRKKLVVEPGEQIVSRVDYNVSKSVESVDTFF